MKGWLSSSEATSGSSPDLSLRLDTLKHDSLKAQKKALHLEEAQLRNERREVRKQREEEDNGWKKLKAQRKEEKATPKGVSSAQKKAQDECWKAGQKQRQEPKNRRHEEKNRWRRKRRAFKERKSQGPSITAWIAILVSREHCTRHCRGLPLFIEGSSMTSAFIVTALHDLLPDQLQVVITDRGPQFRADGCKEFLGTQGVTLGLIAKHRPQSTGIAERFVRTIKEWGQDTTWGNLQELKTLIERCLVEDNDRPHQGLPRAGLSPNEFAHRFTGGIV